MGKKKIKENMDLVTFLQRIESKSFRSKSNSLASIVGIGLIMIFSAYLFFASVNTSLDNPFIQSLDVAIPNGNQYWRDIDGILNERSYKEKFDINQTTNFFRWYEFVKDYEHDTFKTYFGRTVTTEDPTLATIFKKSVRGSLEDFFEKNDRGVVVTEELLRNSNYPSTSSHLYLYNNASPNESFCIPIIAIVEELPSRTSILYSEQFYLNYLDPYTGNLSNYHSNPLGLFIPGNEEEVISKLKLILKSNQITDFSGLENAELSNDSHLLGYVYTITIHEDQYLSNRNKIDLLYQEISNSFPGTFRMYTRDIDEGRIPSKVEANYISIHLNKGLPLFGRNVDLIALREVLLSGKLDIDISKLEQKKVIRQVFLSVMIFALFCFLLSTVFVFSYVESSLNSYFKEIRKCYGQLKAMGLPNKDLIEANTRVIRQFLALATFKALKWVIPIMLIIGIVTYFSGVISLSISNAVVLSVIILLVVISFFISKAILEKLLKDQVANFINRNPGELIYNHDFKEFSLMKALTTKITQDKYRLAPISD